MCQSNVGCPVLQVSSLSDTDWLASLPRGRLRDFTNWQSVQSNVQCTFGYSGSADARTPVSDQLIFDQES